MVGWGLHAGVVAAERRAYSTEEALHPGGDGPCADGKEPVQRAADGAAGSGAVDGDDQVHSNRLQVYTHTLFVCIEVRLRVSFYQTG